jgi:TRAP-type uncharacterized transport system fused permease subunit
MKDKETDFQTEDLSKIVTRLIAGVGIAMSVYHLYTGYFGAPEALLHRSTHLFFTMTLIFFLFPISKKDWAIEEIARRIKKTRDANFTEKDAKGTSVNLGSGTPITWTW